jgi:glycosyltransferase involved in cell wall biosynthesis/SAM-dependent methyltransferase
VPVNEENRKQTNHALEFTGERLVPGAPNCEPTFDSKMYHEHSARYRFAAQLVAGKRVLDVGCGVGYGSALLADAGAAEIVAFDASQDAIDHAREHYARPAITFTTGLAESFSLGTFDVITCFELIEHVEEQDAVLDRIAAALATEGVAFISTPRPLADRTRSAFHVRELPFDAFRSLLERHFSHSTYWFEGNQFGSRIDVNPGTRVPAITLMKPEQFASAGADYFIAVVGHVAPPQNVIVPVVVADDDAYVSTLERDVETLREAEKRFTEQIDAARAAARLRTRELERQINREKRLREEAEQHAEEAEQHAVAMSRTISWRVTRPLRLLRQSGRDLRGLSGRIADARRRRGTVGALAAALKRAPIVVGTSQSQPRSASTDVMLSDAEALAALQSRTVDAAFLIGCWDGESKRYRVANVVDGLRESGISVLVLDYADAHVLLEYDIAPQTLVVFRAPLRPDDGKTRRVFRQVRARGGRVIADFDDLVFEPSIVNEIDGFRSLSEPDRATYVEGVHGYRRMLEAVDLMTCPTPYLADYARKLGFDAEVVRNSLDRAQLDLAETLVHERRHGGDVVRIAYLSGSRTHEADFAVGAAALERVLDDRPQTTFTVVGHLELPDRLKRFGSRIAHIPFMHYLDLLRTTRSFDINIAPLVVGDRFCEAKSELKVFESGTVEVPTVASDTTSYAAAIDDGVDGFLARTTDEWYSKLIRLVDSPDLRERMGVAARKRAVSSHSYEVAAREFKVLANIEVPQSAPPAEPAHRSSPHRRISWIVPGLIIGGGGHRNIFRAAHQLEQMGYEVELYFTDWHNDDDHELSQLISKHFYPLKAKAMRYRGRIAPCDVLFATHWSTVQPALDNRSNAREVMYFVQDFEPYFYPMGTEYLLAENTYRQDLYHITSGPWCERVLRTRFNAEADHFQFPIDTEIYFPRTRTDVRRRILYFAKPEMPRRCYELGVEALRKLNRVRPDVELVFFGSPVDARSLGFPATTPGVLDLDELATLYSNSDLGIVFSPTNPSLVPYEMMACGLPVVDLQGELTELNYGGREDIALLVPPDPERIAAALSDLLADEADLRARSRRGQELAATFPTEAEMGARIAELIEARLELGTRQPEPTGGRR